MLGVSHVSLSTNISMDVQGVFLATVNSVAGCNHFGISTVDWTYSVQGIICLSTASGMNVQGVSLAVWTCRLYPYLNAGLSSIWSVRYRNEQKCRCQNQSSTGIRGPSPVPECSGTGLRYRMPVCRCPAMQITWGSHQM
jgi:hypothetical protein